MDGKYLAELVANGDTPPRAYDNRARGLFSLRNSQGDIVAAGLTESEARTTRTFYRNFFGGTFDIIETETFGVDGERVFTGNPSNFSHVPSHVSSDVPMFDVQIDGKIVARNLTQEAAQAFIRESVDILDIFAAIAEYIVTSDISHEYAMDVLENLTMADVYGVTLIRYNPVENDAPVPTPGIKDWKPAKKTGREKIRKVKEIAYQATPVEFHEWSVLDVASLDVLYSGTKKSCLAYMNAKFERGDKLHQMRVMRCEKVKEYKAFVKFTGWKVIRHGETVCQGTREEVHAYIIDRKLYDGPARLTTKVERISK